MSYLFVVAIKKMNRICTSPIVLSSQAGRFFSASSISKDAVVIVEATRTPIGAFNGSLSQLTAPQLGSVVIKSLLDKTGLKGEQVDEVIFGNVIQGGIGQAPTRQAALGAGMPIKTATTTVNKVCASGMKSIMMSFLAIQGNKSRVSIAGGFESMSNAPFYVRRGDHRNLGDLTMECGIMKDALTDAYQPLKMGNCAENTAKNLKITREEQDAYAIRSYELTFESAKSGKLAKEITPVEVKTRKGTVTISEDEEYKRFDRDSFVKMRTVFQKDGTVTAGNASKINDGAAGCILMKASTASQLGLSVLGEIIDFADSAVEPIDFPIAPYSGILELLTRNSLKIEDISQWEINEAFSVVALANAKLLGLKDIANVNPLGGAVSLGHPVGMSGARIVNRLVHHLAPGQLGIAGICNGGGGASSLLLRKL